MPRAAVPRRRTRTLLIAAVIVAVVVGGAYAIWHARAPAPGTPAAGGPRRDPNAKPAPVAVAKAKSQDFNVYLNALGTVTPRASVTVRSRVDGQLARVLFKEGDTVKAGAVLAEIDPRTFEVQVSQAQGQLAKDRALLANANVDLQRYKTLLAQDSIASQQVDTQASLVRQYEASIASDQAQVDSAKLQLSFTRITAPIAGRLGLRQVDVGNMIHVSDSNGLVLLTQIQPIDVVFALPETNLPAVLRQMKQVSAMPVDALSRDQSRKLASGTLLTVDNSIDTTTGTVKLKAAFDNADASLFPNQFVNVRMLVDTLHDATVVPSAAVQRGTQGNFVYVVGTDNVVKLSVVKLGPVDGETTVIDKGVATGDVVVIDGTDRLREGQTVETVSRDTTIVPTGAPKGRSGKGAGNGQGRRAKGGATESAPAAPGAASAAQGAEPAAVPGAATQAQGAPHTPNATPDATAKARAPAGAPPPAN
ncbi:MAG TPA: MdtA/MuxA family multidrug efflux RND transporter periplasmic adaptor subunit [Casimicrobiaceae bacterium]|nr:MdtA/MuxA family multidrug efflux RND transporter periplasmic adaptor subunit [Casimicrobiaceae bacterium]